jgi:DNA-binding transcriptional LysR family regulator
MLHNDRMILDGIDVFVKVVQAGGFSAAARQLGMPTTTVSAKIARLEQRLGVTLIQRSTRRLHVTAAGEGYFAHCLAALKAVSEGEEQLAAATAEPNGLLRLTAPPDLSQSVLAHVVRRYLAAYPKASVDMVVTNVPVDLLAEGIDLAVRASPMQDSSLISRKFAMGHFRLFASAEYVAAQGLPRSPAELGGHEVLAHSKLPPHHLRLVSPQGAFALQTSSRLRADDMQTLRALTAMGAGIGLLPDLGEFEPAGRTLIPVLPEFATPETPVFFVYPAQRFVPVNVRAFIEMAVKTTLDPSEGKRQD